MTVLVTESPKEVPEASDLAHLLREIGIDYAQGFAIEEPMRLTDLT